MRRKELIKYLHDVISAGTAASLIFFLATEAPSATSKAKSADQVGIATIISRGEAYSPVAADITMREGDLITHTRIVSPNVQSTLDLSSLHDVTIFSSISPTETLPRILSGSNITVEKDESLQLIEASATYTESEGSLEDTIFNIKTQNSSGTEDGDALASAIINVGRVDQNKNQLSLGYHTNNGHMGVFTSSSGNEGTLTINPGESLESAVTITFSTARLLQDLTASQVIYSRSEEIPQLHSLKVIIGQAIPAQYAGRKVTLIFKEINPHAGLASGSITDIETGETSFFFGIDKDTSLPDNQIIEPDEIVFDPTMQYLPYLESGRAIVEN